MPEFGLKFCAARYSSEFVLMVFVQACVALTSSSEDFGQNLPCLGEYPGVYPGLSFEVVPASYSIYKLK